MFWAGEPLPGLHERYVAAQWRQALGSTMHCAAGDGVGILVGAVIGSLVALPLMPEFALEYMLGFAFGWAIFQALFMGEMFGSYWKALKGTFSSEFLSMNCLMGGMLPVSALAFQSEPDAHDPTEPLFWFRMSLALMVGALCAYPVNYWLVAHHLKHGMMSVRPSAQGEKVSGSAPMKASEVQGMHMSKSGSAEGHVAGMSMAEKIQAAKAGSALHQPSPPVWVMAMVSLAVLTLGIAITLTFAG